MQITVREESGPWRWPCCFCGGEIHPNQQCADVEDSDGTYHGICCLACIQSGTEGIRERALRGAKVKLRRAMQFLEESTEIQPEDIVLPS